MEKSFLKSKTIIGVIISVLPTFLPMFGLSFSAQDGAFLTGAIDTIVTTAGALFAMYGRVVAKSDLTI